MILFCLIFLLWCWWIISEIVLKLLFVNLFLLSELFAKIINLLSCLFLLTHRPVIIKCRLVFYNNLFRFFFSYGNVIIVIVIIGRFVVVIWGNLDTWLYICWDRIFIINSRRTFQRLCTSSSRLLYLDLIPLNSFKIHLVIFWSKKIIRIIIIGIIILRWFVKWYRKIKLWRLVSCKFHLVYCYWIFESRSRSQWRNSKIKTFWIRFLHEIQR